MIASVMSLSILCCFLHDVSVCVRSSCYIHPKNSMLEFGQRLNLTLEVPCNVTHVEWQTSGIDGEALIDNLHLNDNDIIQSDLGSVRCDQESKQAFFNIIVTEENHIHLNGIILALGYLEGHHEFECISLPPARYTINTAGKF